MWLSKPSIRTAVVPSCPAPAPTPDASLPPRRCQPGATPAVIPANSSYQAAPSAPRTNTTPTPGAGLAAPTSPLPRPPSDRQPDQWAPSVLCLTQTAPSVPTMSTYRVPPTFTAAGPLPASTRPPRPRQGPATVVSSRSQTAPSLPRTTASMASPPVTERAPAATPGRDVSTPPKDCQDVPVDWYIALLVPRAKRAVPRPSGAGTKVRPGPPTRVPPRDSSPEGLGKTW